VSDRLYNDHSRKQARFRELEARLAAKAARDAPTFRPQINPPILGHEANAGARGGGGGGGGDGDLSKRLTTWKRRRSERLAEGLKVKEEEELAALRATPAINASSSRVAERHIAEGLRDPDVAEHLYALAPQMEDKLVRMRAQKMADEEPNSPLITRMAKDLEREGTIGDRLYKAAVDQQDHLERMRREHEDESDRKAKREASRKHANEVSAAQRSGRVGHSLYERAVENMKKKDEMRLKKQREIIDAQTQKHITPRSRKLAAASREASMKRLAKLTPRAVRERELWKRKQDARAGHNADSRELPHQHRGVGNSDLEFFRPSEELDEEHTHAPAVNPVSAIVAEVRNQRRFPGEKGKNFGHRLYSDAKNWRRKTVEQLKKEQDAKEMAECTFAPNTARSKRTFVATMGYDIEEAEVSQQREEGGRSGGGGSDVEGNGGNSNDGDNDGVNSNDDDDTRSVVSRASTRRGGGGGSGVGRSGVSHFNTPDRLVRWQQNKDRRIKQMQKAQYDKATKDCTFRPNLNASKKSRSSTPKSKGDSSSPNMPARRSGAPKNTLRRSIAAKVSEDERSNRATFMFYERQRRALQDSGKRKTSLSPQTSFHTHPDLTSHAPSVDVMTNDPDFVVNQGGGAQLLTDPVIAARVQGGANESGGGSPGGVEYVEKHLRRMARARSNRALNQHSQLENQLRNRWSVNGSTNPDLIAINAEQSTVPKRHKERSPPPRKTTRASKSPNKTAYMNRVLRKPVMPEDFRDHLEAYERARRVIRKGNVSPPTKTSPKSTPLPRR
jgi:hypothetical protein